VTFPFIVNLGFAFKIIMDELTKFDSNDRAKLLKTVQNLTNELEKDNEHAEDLLEKGKYPSDTVGPNKIRDKSQIFNELSGELKKATIDLKKVNKELNDEFREIKRNLKEVIDITNKPTGGIKLKDVKTIIRNLEQVKRSIEIIEQVEDFTKELKEVDKFTEKLNGLIERIKKIKKINIEGFNTLMKKLKKNIELLEVLKEAKKLDLVKANKYVEELGKRNVEEISNSMLVTELEDVNNYMGLIENKLSLPNRDDHAEQSGRCSYILEEITEQIRKIKDIVENVFEKIKVAVNRSEKDQSTKTYRKFSNWLKDYRDNQIILVIFTILAGVNISHLELLGSTLQFRTLRLKWLESKIPSRIRDLNFNARLSRAAKHKLFWGNIVNIVIEDICGIFIQVCNSFFFINICPLLN
jgi:hypothetical protein